MNLRKYGVLGSGREGLGLRECDGGLKGGIEWILKEVFLREKE